MKYRTFTKVILFLGLIGIDNGILLAQDPPKDQSISLSREEITFLAKEGLGNFIIKTTTELYYIEDDHEVLQQLETLDLEEKLVYLCNNAYKWANKDDTHKLLSAIKGYMDILRSLFSGCADLPESWFAPIATELLTETIRGRKAWIDPLSHDNKSSIHTRWGLTTTEWLALVGCCRRIVDLIQHNPLPLTRKALKAKM